MKTWLPGHCLARPTDGHYDFLVHTQSGKSIDDAWVPAVSWPHVGSDFSYGTLHHDVRSARTSNNSEPLA
jgi:hypothetical protein